jgi:hypothetical protein
LIFVNLLWEQRLKIFIGHGFWEILEQVFQVPVGFQAVGLGGFNQAVNGCAGPGTLGRAGEQPVLPFMQSSA